MIPFQKSSSNISPLHYVRNSSNNFNLTIVIVFILCWTLQEECLGQRGANDAEGFLTVPSIGMIYMNNTKLNRWLEANGDKPITSIAEIDLISLIIKNNYHGWYYGGTLGFLLSNSNQFTPFFASFNYGKRIISSDRFQSNLNGNLVFMQGKLRDVVPQSISNPDPKNEVWANCIAGIGISNANYFKVLTTNKKRLRKEDSLYLGLEYGINGIVMTDWSYGQWVSMRHFVGTTVANVPHLDPYYTYLKFSISLKF